MKFSALLILIAILTSSSAAFAREELGGIYYVCTNDPDQERHFLGTPNRGTMEDEARKLAKDSCDNISGGTAMHMVYVYKDGSQKDAN